MAITTPTKCQPLALATYAALFASTVDVKHLATSLPKLRLQETEGLLFLVHGAPYYGPL